MPVNNKLYERRKSRIRYKLKKVSNRVRLSVFRSQKHIYVQLIDDVKGITVASASTLDTEIRGIATKTATVSAAVEVGKLIAKRAIAKNISSVVFDRGSYLYHGRVKALADAAREGGLLF